MLFLIANKLTYTETTGMHGERNTRNESEGCPIDKYRLGHSENHTSENVSEVVK